MSWIFVRKFYFLYHEISNFQLMKGCLSGKADSCSMCTQQTSQTSMAQRFTVFVYRSGDICNLNVHGRKLKQERIL